MARLTWVQSQVESYQRLKKWYLMPPCLTFSVIRHGSRVKWSNPGKGGSVLPLHLGVIAIEKGDFGSPSTMVANLNNYCRLRRYLALLEKLPPKRNRVRIYIYIYCHPRTVSLYHKSSWEMHQGGIETRSDFTLIWHLTPDHRRS